MVKMSKVDDCNLRSAINDITITVSTDSKWKDYEVLNAALEQEKMDVVNYLLDHDCAVNKYPSTPANTPLHYAVMLGDISLVNKLLEKGADVTTVNVDADSPLHLAFLLDYTKIVDLILDNIQHTVNYEDVSNNYGLTHFHIACARGNTQVAHDFDYTGANITSIVSKESPVYPNYTCLRFACESKSIGTIEVVVRSADPPTNCINDTPREQAVSLATLQGLGHSLIKMHHEEYSLLGGVRLSFFQSDCFYGFVDEVKIWLEEGQDVNTVMTQRAIACPLYTPLHFTIEAKKNRQKVVELLLAYGANVDLKDGFCMTPLHLALYNDRNCKDVQDDNTLKILYTAVKDKEANPMDLFGLTYFHVAVALNDMKTVKKLIKKGEGNYKPILPNCRNFAKYTPLHFAAKYGHEDMAKLFIKRGADVNANENESQFETPLQTAVKYGQCKMVELLLVKGANAKVTTYETKLTILHLLVERFNNYKDKSELLGLVKTLVKHGADINAKDEKLNTALHKACGNLDECASIAYELLAWGADVNLKNWRLETAIDIAYHRVEKNTTHNLLPFHYHIQKLKELGLKIDPKNESVCEMIMAKKEDWDLQVKCERESLANEIEKLKIDMLDEKLSLYDYLKMDVEQAIAYAQNERINNLTSNGDCTDYPNYGYLIVAMHWNSLSRLAAQQPKKQSNIEKTEEMVVVKKPLLRRKAKSSSTTQQKIPANATLFNVVNLGNTQRVKEMVTKGASIKNADSEKNSPLHLAFISNHEEIVDLFLSHIKDKPNHYNLKNNHGLTFLHIAASRGNKFVVQKLLEAKADPQDFVSKNSPYYPGYTALQFACDSKSLATVKLLSSVLNLLNNTSNETADMLDKKTKTLVHRMQKEFKGTSLAPFHTACLVGRFEDVKKFLENGQNVNEIADRNSKLCPMYTALHFAVESEIDRQKKVELLLKYGADVEIRNGFCMTPLHLLFYVDRKKNMSKDCLNEHDEDETLKLLYEAVEDKEANPMDAFGFTYFHIAAALNDCILVKRMLFRGEDVNSAVLQNSHGFSKYTPLHFAAKYGKHLMIKLLIARGANVNANEDDLRFNTPLQVAISAGEGRAAEVLLDNGANAKVIRPAGNKTIIHLLAEEIVQTPLSMMLDFLTYDQIWLVEKLVKLDVDIDAKDSDGYTALHIVCLHMYNHYELIESLLANGADINVKDKKGDTALDLAFRETFKHNYLDYANLYQHVQKLKDLGLTVDPKNEQFCESVMAKKDSWIELEGEVEGEVEKLFSKETLAKKRQRRQKEIEILKTDMLTDDVSLYDYLKMSPNQAAAYAKNERIQYIVEDDEPRVLYEIYGYLIPVIYRKSLKCLESQGNIKKRSDKKKCK